MKETFSCCIMFAGNLFQK